MTYYLYWLNTEKVCNNSHGTLKTLLHNIQLTYFKNSTFEDFQDKSDVVSETAEWWLQTERGGQSRTFVLFYLQTENLILIIKKRWISVPIIGQLTLQVSKRCLWSATYYKHKQCIVCCYLYLRGGHVNSQCDQRQDQYDVGKGVVWNTESETHSCTGQPT